MGQPEPLASSIVGSVLVPVGHGELLDRIVILEIKAERIHDPHKRANVLLELHFLRGVIVPVSGNLKAALHETNETLWNVENALREHERDQDFGPEFVELARSVYRLNDRRAAIKREIDERTGSTIVEEKSYPLIDADEPS